MSTETIAAGTGAQFNSFASLREAQKSFGPEKRLQSHCKSAHGGAIKDGCSACAELSGFVNGNPMDARNS